MEGLPGTLMSHEAHRGKNHRLLTIHLTDNVHP